MSIWKGFIFFSFRPNRKKIVKEKGSLCLNIFESQRLTLYIVRYGLQFMNIYIVFSNTIWIDYKHCFFTDYMTHESHLFTPNINPEVYFRLFSSSNLSIISIFYM